MAINSTESTMRKYFNDEWRMIFERAQPLLKQTVNTDGIVNAKTVTFDYFGTTGRGKQRQRDGRLPYTRPDTYQVEKDLVEHYEPYVIDSFDDFRNNPTIRAGYMKKSAAVVKREIDEEILAELATTPTEYSASAQDFADKAFFVNWTTSLWDNDVDPGDGQTYGVLTPKAFANMMMIDEFVSADYVDIKAFVEGAPPVGQAKRWLGVNWIIHTGLPEKGSALAHGYIYHKTAIGHVDDGEPTFLAGYDERDDQHFCWSRARHCAKAILTRGISRAYHDDTAAVSSS